VIDSAVAIYLARFAEPGVKLQVEECDANFRVIGDSMLLAHTVFSIMQNAREALIGSGDAEAWIRLRVFDDAGEIVVELSNSGGGIPAEIRDRIFDPFFSTKEGGRAKGYGLGLTFAKNIVAKHHGKLSLRSDTNETTFRIVLPRAAQASPAPVSRLAA
jgi:signal transduction histidine kinase